MKYEVTRRYIRMDTWYVEADTRDEAKEIASNSKVNETVEFNNTKHTGQYVVIKAGTFLKPRVITVNYS
jgi:hypothetical protein|tara:strand:+ start:258 stop:464 length:207 start_codon:yes stop_codon:yes gene_type:complete